MYTTHHPCWDAKNRYGLPDECEFDYSVIKHIIEPENIKSAPAAYKPSAPKIEKPDQAKQQPVAAEGEQITLPMNQPDPPQEESFPAQDPKIPRALRDLMEKNRVCEWDIQNVVAAKGYFPADMPVRDYPEDFISGVLVGAWGQVYAMIKQMKENQEIPFN